MGGVAAEVGHVGEDHVAGVRAQLVAKQTDLAGAHGDEHRLVLREALTDERGQPGDVVVVGAVEERLVPKRGRVSRDSYLSPRLRHQPYATQPACLQT